jgi:non-canonical purine NTP pyrophosphatase (RdgB/HAM1 family)
MRTFTFISGNQHKVYYLEKWLGVPIDHHHLDLEEVQSLSLRTVAEHKARQAYDLLQRPVLVEDVGLTMKALGRLPGPFIKWFIEDLGDTGLCRFAAGLEHQQATVSIVYAFFDGQEMHLVENHVEGEVAPEPRGTHGFGWNAVFIPEGSTKTYAEMTDDEVRPFSVRGQAIETLREFLES